MKAQSNDTKWFLNAQKKFRKKLDNNYLKWSCNFQDETNLRLYESYTCFDKKENSKTILVIFYKQSGLWDNVQYDMYCEGAKQ